MADFNAPTVTSTKANFPTEVRNLAAELGVPEKIIKRIPSAGLWRGQTDEGELGMSYEELDRTITAIENGKTEGMDKKVLSKVKKMIEDSKHKRCEIPVWRG